MGKKFYQHPLALVESEAIGAGTRVWAWAHVMAGATVGADCNIGEHCFIESGAVLGDRVTVKNGVAVWDGVEIEDDVFLGPSAVLTNDLTPRSKGPFSPVPTRLEQGCSIGANATVLAGLRIGRYALVGAGAVVTREVAAHELIVGNPGRRAGYACVCGETLDFGEGSATCGCGRTYRESETGVELSRSPARP